MFANLNDSLLFFLKSVQVKDEGNFVDTKLMTRLTYTLDQVLLKKLYTWSIRSSSMM